MLVGSWQNPFHHLDVSGDGLVVPLDALAVINELNARNLVASDGQLPELSEEVFPPPFHDVSGDDFLVPNDALQIINALNLDTEPPDIEATLAFDSAPGGGTNDDFLTSNPLLVGVVDDQLGVRSLNVQVDGSPPIAAVYDKNSGVFTFDPGFLSNGSHDGQHTIIFTAADAKGNTTAPHELTFRLDTRVLTSVPDLDTDDDSGPSDTDNVTNIATPTILVEAERDDLVTLLMDGVSVRQQVATGTVEFHMDVPLAEGPHEFVSMIEDAAGNQSHSGSLTVMIDTIDPLLEVSNPFEGATTLFYRFDDSAESPVAIDRFGTFDRELFFTDVQDGVRTLTVTATDVAGNRSTDARSVTVDLNGIPFTVDDHFPLDGSSDVGVTFRPRVFFSKPIDPNTLSADNFYASFGGKKLPTRIVAGGDGMFAWLFPQESMPGGSMIEVTVDGSTIVSADGEALDANADGVPGGRLTYQFSTVGLRPLIGTSLTGVVMDPGPDRLPLPHAVDEFFSSLDGSG